MEQYTTMYETILSGFIDTLYTAIDLYKVRRKVKPYGNWPARLDFYSTASSSYALVRVDTEEYLASFFEGLGSYTFSIDIASLVDNSKLFFKKPLKYIKAYFDVQEKVENIVLVFANKDNNLLKFAFEINEYDGNLSFIEPYDDTRFDIAVSMPMAQFRKEILEDTYVRYLRFELGLFTAHKALSIPSIILRNYKREELKQMLEVVKNFYEAQKKKEEEMQKMGVSDFISYKELYEKDIRNIETFLNESQIVTSDTMSTFENTIPMISYLPVVSTLSTPDEELNEMFNEIFPRVFSCRPLYDSEFVFSPQELFAVSKFLIDANAFDKATIVFAASSTTKEKMIAINFGNYYIYVRPENIVEKMPSKYLYIMYGMNDYVVMDGVTEEKLAKWASIVERILKEKEEFKKSREYKTLLLTFEPFLKQLSEATGANWAQELLQQIEEAKKDMVSIPLSLFENNLLKQETGSQ